jgi:phospholipid/cholesterol/gamma-HCH transport system substrate-binding protein
VKKTNVDLIVGGSIIISLIILIGGVLWLKDASISSKMVSYSILFPNVGTLQVGDPVMINGVNKGSVAKIYLRKSEVAVILDIDRSVLLSDSCKFSVQNIGLMGERGIGIQYTENGRTIPPNTKNDTTFVNGTFDTGISEAMGILGTVLVDVQALAGNVASIVQGTVGDSTFIPIFKTMIARLDTISDVAQSLVVKNQPVINNSLKNIQTLSSDLKAILDRNSGHIDTIIINGEKLTDQALIIAARVDSLTESVQNVMSQVEDGKGSLGMLIKDEQFYHDLKKTIADLDTLVNEVQGDALKLRIKIGFGKKEKKRL